VFVFVEGATGLVGGLRNIGALMLGLFGGMCLNMALIQLNMTVLFPMPAGVDMNDAQAFHMCIEGLPAQAFLLVRVAHLTQSSWTVGSPLVWRPQDPCSWRCW
jgi:hypothetical protein